jgi:hypothetical protein
MYQGTCCCLADAAALLPPCRKQHHTQAGFVHGDVTGQLLLRH